MISLTIFSVTIVVSLLIDGYVLALAARLAGSRHGRMARGVGLSLLILPVNIAFAVLTVVLRARWDGRSNAAVLVLLIAELVLIFVILRRGFALRMGRTLIPLGAYLVLGVLQILLARVIIKPLLVEAFVLPTKSMSPTIEPGGRFVVNKLIRPRRLDLVAYRSAFGHHSIWVKRLIGLPGDRLRFQGGRLYVNDAAIRLPTALAGHCHASVPGLPTDQIRYQERQTITLGPDQYFFIGDNADVSLDSRYTGPSTARSIVGVVDLVYWPPRAFRILR